MEIFIPGNVPSMKNQKIKTSNGLHESDIMVKYIRKTAEHWVDNKPKFRLMVDLASTSLIFLHLTFVRKSRHKFDYVNPCETVQDLMRDFLWIIDDDAETIVPVFGKYYYDKNNPGVYIKVLREYPTYKFV